MDRRSFLTSLVGGFAAASLGGVALANAAPAAIGAMPTPEAALPAGLTEAVDATDAEYSQYYRRRYRRGYGYRRPYRRYRGYRRPDRRTRPNSQR